MLKTLHFNRGTQALAKSSTNLNQDGDEGMIVRCRAIQNIQCDADEKDGDGNNR